MANTNPLAANLTLEQQKNLFGNAYLNMLWHCPTDQRFHYWVHLPDCYYDEAELALRDVLNRVVHISGTKKKAALTIEFYGEEDLKNLLYDLKLTDKTGE